MAVTQRRLGDWRCPCGIKKTDIYFLIKVGETNFAARVRCRRCNKPARASYTYRPKFGDWRCPSCSELNFGSRVVCRKCNAQRPVAGESGKCVVCFEGQSEVVLAPCGHLVLCTKCAETLTDCPMCRKPYNKEQIIKVFKA